MRENVTGEELNKKPSGLRKFLQISISLFLGIVILYFLYRRIHLRALWTTIKDANWWILSFSLIFGLAGNSFRGLRWNLIVRSLGYKPRLSNILYAVWGNYAINFAIPRAGEIWRCGVISEKEKIPFSKLLGTLIVDRAFDTVMVAIICMAAAALNIPVFTKHLNEFNLPRALTSPQTYFWISAGMALPALFFFLFRKTSFVKKTGKLLGSIWKDIQTIGRMKQKKLFVIYSFCIWIGYFLYFFVTFFAFDFTYKLGFAAALFIFTVSSISMAIPSNGGLGPWQAAVVFGLVAYRVKMEQAIAFATAVFAFQSIWIVLCGLAGIAALSKSKSKASRDLETSDSADS